MNNCDKVQYGSGGAAGKNRDGIGALGAGLRLAAAALAAAMTAAMSLAPTGARAQDRLALAGPVSSATERVTVGQSQDVRTDRSFADIMVSDPDIAVVSPLTDRSFSILGKKIGATRVTAYDQNKFPVKIFNVQVSYDLSGLTSAIAQFAGAGIKVSWINNHVLLSGVASDAATLDRAVMIARQFDKDAINTVRVAQQQVMLEVRFIEVSRSASRELGVQWNAFSGNRGVVNVGDQAVATPAPGAQPSGVPLPVTDALSAAGVLSGTPPFGFAVGELLGGKNPLSVSINALEQKGLARSLAEPNLVALSGDTASFLAGGEIPVPQVSATGTPSFAYQPYGVGLSFTPTVLKDGLINLVINPEVSEIDPSTTVTIAGSAVPGLTMRKASTTLELRDGQSFMLGGLLQDTGNTAQDQLPWVGNLPVIGALFRSSQYQKNETDLVIVVTPHIVRPLSPVAQIHTPLDGTLPANDVDFFLMGRPEVSPALVRLAAGAPNRPYVGHILDLPKQGGVYVSARD